MAQRVVVGLHQGADTAAVKAKLAAAGADSVSDPSDVQPDVLIATIPSEADAEGFVRQAKQIAGVRYAEPEAWRFSS